MLMASRRSVDHDVAPDVPVLGEQVAGLVAQPRAQPGHHVLDGRLAMAGAEIGVGDAGQGLHLFGADLGGPGPESTVGGQQAGRDRDV